MDAPLVFEGNISAATIVGNMPSGGKVFVQTNEAALTVEWYDPKSGTWSNIVNVAEPGAELNVFSPRARITPVGPTNIRIVIRN